LVLAFGISFQKGIGTLSWATTEKRPRIDHGEAGTPRAQAINNMGKAVGDELMTRYVIAFEVAGLLLTVAVVGAIAVAHRDDSFAEPDKDAKRKGREPAATAIPPVTPAVALSSAPTQVAH
jgi:NADH-quinone oxidoreductase subunit J